MSDQVVFGVFHECVVGVMNGKHQPHLAVKETSVEKINLQKSPCRLNQRAGKESRLFALLILLLSQKRGVLIKLADGGAPVAIGVV